MERATEDDKMRVEEQRVETTSSDLVAEEPVQHVHAKTIVLLIAIVSVYTTTVIYVTGCGLLANAITATVGGANKSIWLVSVIAIAACALAPPVSQAADFWGRKWLCVALTAPGVVGSIICGRATSFGMLIGGQVIAALSMGSQPLVHAIAGEIIPRKYRPLAQATTTTAAALGGVIGILMGGSLVRSNPAGWRTYFYITAGLYLIETILVAWLYTPPKRDLEQKLTTKQKLTSIDWTGYILFIPGLVLFSYALTSSTGVYPWKSSKIIGPLVVGVVLLFAFAVYEWKFNKKGILHHRLFSKDRNFPLVVGLYFCEGAVFYAANSYYAFEDSVVYGRGLFTAGLHFTYGWFLLIPATYMVGLYASRTKTLRVPTIIGFIFFLVFCATMASLDLSDRSNIIGYVMFFGIGNGTLLTLLLTTAQLSTPAELISTTTGLIMCTRSVGGTVGLAIFSAIFSGVLDKEIPKKVIENTAPLGLDPKYLGLLISGITHHNFTELDSIPDITPAIIEAGGLGLGQAYSLGFRYIWVAAACINACALIGAFFIIDPKSEFTSHIDAPIETDNELSRAGMMEKFHTSRYHHQAV